MKPIENLIAALSAEYVKAAIQHPKDVIHANIERAVMAVPVFAAAPDVASALKELQRDMLGTVSELQRVRALNAQLLQASKDALNDITQTVNYDEGDEQTLATVAALEAAIAKAEGR